MSNQEIGPESIRDRLKEALPGHLSGKLRPMNLVHAMDRRKAEAAAFRDLAFVPTNGLHISYGPMDEVVDLLSSNPLPTDYEAHPKTVDWHEREEVDVTENPLFDDFSLHISSNPTKQQIVTELMGKVREGAVLRRRSKLTQKLVLDAVCNGSLTYNGEPLNVSSHYPSGDGIGFNFILADSISVAVEFMRFTDEDDEETNSVIKVRMSSKAGGTKESDDEYKARVRRVLDSSREVMGTMVQIFTDAYAGEPSEPMMLEMPIDALRNRQTGKHSHKTVEAPESITNKDDVTLFQQIARHPGELGFGIIGGLEKPIDEMRRLIMISKHPEAFESRGLSQPNCVLLYGPPGTGKSLLAEVAAKELDGHYLKVDCSDILIKWVGESEARIRSIFRLVTRIARDKPVTIFFDEFDTLGSKKKENSPEWMRSIVNTMLTAINELPRNCIAIAAVNDIDALEPAIKREGRFSRIAVNPPTPDARRKIIQNWVDHYNRQPAGIAFEEIDIDQVVRATDGFCGADIQALLSRALMSEVISGLMDGVPARPCDHDSLIRALAEMKSLKGDIGAGSTGMYL